MITIVEGGAYCEKLFQEMMRMMKNLSPGHGHLYLRRLSNEEAPWQALSGPVQMASTRLRKVGAEREVRRVYAFDGRVRHVSLL